MIYVYGILYRSLDYAKTSIKSILDTASEPIHLTIIDSKSTNSPAILEYFTKEVGEGRINRFIYFDSNVRGYGLTEAYKKYPPDNSESFFVFTDLDIVVDFDWISILRNSQSHLHGFSLSLENYVSPNAGHNPDVGFGTWLVKIDKDMFNTYYIDKHPYRDSLLIEVFKQHGEVSRSDNTLYHLSWDLWKDDPEYWEEKVKGVDWLATPETLTYKVCDT